LNEKDITIYYSKHELKLSLNLKSFKWYFCW